MGIDPGMMMDVSPRVDGTSVAKEALAYSFFVMAGNVCLRAAISHLERSRGWAQSERSVSS